MKYRRNLAVAAVTAAVVTTALVGTTLPDLVADRAANAVEQNDKNSVAVTELPAVPSAKEISTARDSSQATDQMIDEISDRISQASQRALELETSMQEQHQAAVQAQVEADEAAAEADEARTAAEETQAAAVEEYQEPETSAAEVLLTEEDSLADAATDAQLEEQAELDAVAAEQAAAEAESLAEQARQNSTSAAEAEENADRATETTRNDVEQVGETLQGLLENLMELEGWEGDLQSFFEQILGNSDFIDENGDVDHEQLTYRITALRADAEQARITDEAAEEAAEAAAAEEAATAEAEESAAAEETAELEEAAAQAAEAEAAEAAAAEQTEAAETAAAEEAAAEEAAAAEAAAAEAAAAEAEAEEAAAAQAAAAAEETSSEGADGEAAPSEEPQPAPAPEPAIASFGELSTTMQSLMRQGAELESSFSGGAQDYYRAVLSNDALTNADGNASWNKMRWHVDYLAAQVEPEPEPEPTRAPAPAPERTQAPAPAPAPEPTRAPAPAPERTQAPAPTQSQSQSSNVVPASSNSNGAEIAINWAVAQANRGDVSYVLGANGPNAFDCSSLIQQAFGQAGVSLSRTTFSQVNEGQAVSVGDMRRGDLIFFGSATAPGHVGIYLGNGQMVDASNPSRGITVRSVYQTPSAVRRMI
ncbi:C40 family peptidase [Nesterenkonia sandarakina]|uniref:Cell wall-associated NlpC family hydrolase n=1 Tax=Nesterenkonia sandarakina TaxID=272918 RepID=A0A2T0YRG9_9MICC|nr:C40 family peptidase [Nesterenkonia sandarakina]PRZ17809.1 cell wall-associated NlpC family hydrolase [Nesterenkonia sandarakina]